MWEKQMYRLGQYLIIAGIIVAQLPGAVLHKDFMATQPLRFEENQGQISSAARFIARGPNYLPRDSSRGKSADLD